VFSWKIGCVGVSVVVIELVGDAAIVGEGLGTVGDGSRGVFAEQAARMVIPKNKEYAFKSLGNAVNALMMVSLLTVVGVALP
jgi:hypothetical protein